jgi:hypothetical protein
VNVVAVMLAGDELTIDLAGETRPTGVAELSAIAERELGEPIETRVRFTLRELLLAGSSQ